MPCRHTPSLSIAIALALSMALSACGKHPAETPTPPATASSSHPARTGTVTKPAAPATAATATPAPASTAFRVTAITLGHEINAAREITAPTTHFTSDEKTLYASVTTAGSTAKATLSARWDYLRGDGQLITRVSQQLAADGPATTTFTLQNPDLWPEGKYSVQISLDGKPVATQAFEIGKSAK